MLLETGAPWGASHFPLPSCSKFDLAPAYVNDFLTLSGLFDILFDSTNENRFGKDGSG